MGGVIARLAALRHPSRVERLVLCSTMATLPAGAAAAWAERARRVREGGMEAIVDWSLAQWFPEKALAARTPAVEHVRAMVSRASVAGYLAVCAAVPRLDFFERQKEIRTQTLVVAGAADPKLSALAPEALVRAMPDAKLHLLPGAGHFPNLDSTEVFNEAVLDFLR
jgi:pimeloyl-ACP methyl ester carboxylesterase